MERKPAQERVDLQWVENVKENEKKLMHLSFDGVHDIGLGGEEGRGRFDRERYFDTTKALFSFLDTCDKEELPKFLTLNSPYQGPPVVLGIETEGKDNNFEINITSVESRFSRYFLPRTGEQYITARDPKKYPDKFPESDSFVGFDALRELQENGDTFFAKNMSMAWMTGDGRIEKVAPQISREEYVDKEAGKPRFELDEERVLQIVDLLEGHMHTPASKELFLKLKQRIEEISKITAKEKADAIVQKSNEVKNQIKVLLSLLQEKNKLASSDIMIQVGGNPYKVYKGYEEYREGESWYLYFSPKENRLFEAPVKERNDLPDLSRAKEARDEDWISYGIGLSHKLINLLPPELQRQVDRFPQ